MKWLICFIALLVSSLATNIGHLQRYGESLTATVYLLQISIVLALFLLILNVPNGIWIGLILALARANHEQWQETADLRLNCLNCNQEAFSAAENDVVKQSFVLGPRIIPALLLASIARDLGLTDWVESNSYLANSAVLHRRIRQSLANQAEPGERSFE